MNDTRGSKPDTETKPDYRNSFLFSAAAGAGFGFIASLVFLRATESSWPALPVILISTVAAGTTSGLAGLAGTHLDEMLRTRGVSRPLRAVISFCAVALVTLGVAILATLLGFISPDPSVQRLVLWGAGAGLLFGALVAAITYRGELMRQRLELLQMRNRHLEEISRREELLHEAARDLAVNEERNRLAREIHDSISQGVHGIVYSLHSLRGRLSGDPRASEILDHMEETAQSTLEELRHLVRELSPTTLKSRSLSEAIRRHADLLYRRTGIPIDVAISYDGELPPEVEMTIYRILQEALNNVQRHADARSVRVELARRGETIRLTVSDDGDGFDVERIEGGHGLRNMEMRARQNGGSFRVESAPQRGCIITAEFPILENPTR